MFKIKVFSAIALACLLFVSCRKYQVIGEADFPEQTIYMPAAIDGNSQNGVYNINQLATPGRVFRYVADVPGRKLSIPLAVYRAGADLAGAVPVTIQTNADTINQLITVGILPAGTVLLPTSAYTLESSVVIEDGAGEKDFTLSVDLNFLLADITKRYAIAVTVNSPAKESGTFSTTTVLINPAFLVPVAAFTHNVNERTVTFSNTSSFANVWSWDYGDGTPVSTAAAAPHTYANAGNYTVTLTATGALGDFNRATFSQSVTVQ